MVYDVMGEARCSSKDAPILSEYMPACFRFKEK